MRVESVDWRSCFHVRSAAHQKANVNTMSPTANSQRITGGSSLACHVVSSIKTPNEVRPTANNLVPRALSFSVGGVGALPTCRAIDPVANW